MWCAALYWPFTGLLKAKPAACALCGYSDCITLDEGPAEYTKDEYRRWTEHWSGAYRTLNSDMVKVRSELKATKNELEVARELIEQLKTTIDDKNKLLAGRDTPTNLWHLECVYGHLIYRGAWAELTSYIKKHGEELCPFCSPDCGVTISECYLEDDLRLRSVEAFDVFNRRKPMPEPKAEDKSNAKDDF